jgi:hypothetical protein
VSPPPLPLPLPLRLFSSGSVPRDVAAGFTQQQREPLLQVRVYMLIRNVGRRRG